MWCPSIAFNDHKKHTSYNLVSWSPGIPDRAKAWRLAHPLQYLFSLHAPLRFCYHCDSHMVRTAAVASSVSALTSSKPFSVQQSEIFLEGDCEGSNPIPFRIKNKTVRLIWPLPLLQSHLLPLLLLPCESQPQWLVFNPSKNQRVSLTQDLCTSAFLHL